MIAKYGIPFNKAPICTRELKQYAIQAYLRENNIKKDARLMAIGIRADEASRMAKNAVSEKLVYPLVQWGVDKQDILDWWQEQKFDLDIPEHFGNCVWCWKKSYKKLMTIMLEDPKAFDFPEKIKKKYARTGALADKLDIDVRFFRGWKSVQDIRDMTQQGFEKYIDLHHLHITDGCSESCEPFLDEQPITIIENE